MADTGFTDDQRAAIYARDRAICAYSGNSLWLADFGAAPSMVDWIDHRTPLARGGRSTLDNGICASADYNRIKRDHGQGLELYLWGRPTPLFYFLYERLSPEASRHLSRFDLLEPSDWFFNRALWHAKMGAASIGEKRGDGKSYTRGVEYRANAAMNMLKKWRARSAAVAGLRVRGLWPRNPGPDQKLLLSIERADSPLDIAKVIRKLAPYCRASWKAMSRLAEVSTDADATRVRPFLTDPFVSPRVKRAIRHNLLQLRPLLF